MTISKEIFMRLVERYSQGFDNDNGEITFHILPDTLPQSLTDLEPDERAIEIVNNEITRLIKKGESADEFVELRDILYNTASGALR